MKKQKEKSIKFSLFFLLVCLSVTNCVGEKDEFDDDPHIDEIKSDVILEAEYDIHYISPLPSRPVHFAEHFDDIDDAKARWLPSKAQKEENENLFKYDGEWDFNLPHQQILNGDRALVLNSKAKHAAISAKLDKVFEFKDKPLFVQYEVNFQNGMDCGGAYIKLLSHSKNLDLLNFHDKTPYTIMFGPDKCGNDIKLHFIFRHKNPLNGTFEEKHAKRPSNRMEENFSDKRPHLYRLKLYPDNNYEIEVDGISVSNGHLLKDMTPSVNPPLEIEDPNDVKPSDWDEREKIPDTTAAKPDDWDETAPQKIADPNAVMPDDWLEDETEMIPDENAKKPEDWDMDMDGTWEPPMISNPACVDKPGCGPWTPPQIDNPDYKGKWKAPLINNPNYKGKWTRNMISNPDYFEDKEPFKMTPIGAVGLEIWTMTDKVLFDNFLITDDETVLSQWTSQTFDLKKRSLDRDSEGVITRLINYSNAHPWLWAIYILVIGLPLVLIFTFCCGSNQDSKRSDAQRKKTDEPEVNELDPKANAEPKSVSAKNSNTKVGMSKEQLEEPQDDSEDAEELDDEEEEEEDPSADEDGNEDKSENSKSESKEEDDSTKETYTETDPDFESDVPRKRKATSQKE